MSELDEKVTKHNASKNKQILDVQTETEVVNKNDLLTEDPTEFFSNQYNPGNSNYL